jgi:glycosyltransferase involved in cell wall biosynthesis
MVSDNYFLEDANLDSARHIVRTRIYETSGWLPYFLTNREENTFYESHLDGDNFHYLLMVSTIEPRKNHTRLIAAWEFIKSQNDPSLKLVIVGTLGWNYESIRTALASWIEHGEAFLLNAVPAGELRTLYRNALATICPSLGEGFGFSGVEAMRSGGITIASDIPVHREIYDDAAVYFDPHSTASLAESLAYTLYSDHSWATICDLKQRGQEVSGRYLPEVILPKWDRLLAQLAGKPA